MEKPLRDLERTLRKKTMQAQIIKVALNLPATETDLTLTVVERSEGRLPMSVFAVRLGVFRSNLIERASSHSSHEA